MFGSLAVGGLFAFAIISFHRTKNCDATVAIVAVNGSHFVPEGDQASINCSVTREAFIGWFDSDGQKISNSQSERRHVRDDGSQKYLEISKINRTDQGLYECRGKTNKTQVMLYVEYRPIFIREESTHKTIFSSVNSNEQITLTCTFHGFPVPEVSFKRSGNELTNGVTKKPGFASYKFSIKGQGDFGFYTCEGKNRQGTSQHHIEVYEKGPPEPPSNIRVQPNCDRLEVTWEECLNDRGSPVIGYSIELRQDGVTLDSESLSTLSRAKTFKDLDKDTQYLVVMNSENALGVGEWERKPVNTTLICSAKPVSSASDFSILVVLIMSAHALL